MNKKIPIAFVVAALCVLIGGALVGVLAAIQYLEPTFLKETLPFNRLREIHVTSAISWIVLSATGGVYFYITKELGHQIFSGKLAVFHLILFILTGLGIYISIFTGNMGGREYLTFLPVLMIPILLGWIVFGVNYFKTLLANVKGWPVYLWMWGTGIVFMVFHLCEANLWIFDHFRMNFVRDLTVQWKSYGSFTGSWNMLVYGTAIFLMARIKKDENVARTKIAFFFYFLGLTNLMFGWAHHIYPVPSQAWIRYLAYAISMTEWLVLGYMLTNWIKSLSAKEKKENFFPYRLLVITDIWVFGNVLMAVLISIPAINHYSHGSHITVAHSMGTTIGINTPILLASATFMCSCINEMILEKMQKTLSYGLALFNISLIVFLASLIIAGSIKGQWMYSENSAFYSVLTEQIKPYIRYFLFAGIGVFVGVTIVAAPVLKFMTAKLREA